VYSAFESRRRTTGPGFPGAPGDLIEQAIGPAEHLLPLRGGGLAPHPWGHLAEGDFLDHAEPDLGLFGGVGRGW